MGKIKMETGVVVMKLTATVYRIEEQFVKSNPHA